jgi:hypothetical protein
MQQYKTRGIFDISCEIFILLSAEELGAMRHTLRVLLLLLHVRQSVLRAHRVMEF